MPELVIKYTNKRTLAALMDFAKYFDFSIVSPSPKQKEKSTKINGVTVLLADSSVDTSDLELIFSNKKLDAKQLRQNGWQRNK